MIHDGIHGNTDEAISTAGPAGEQFVQRRRAAKQRQNGATDYSQRAAGIDPLPAAFHRRFAALFAAMRGYEHF